MWSAELPPCFFPNLLSPVWPRAPAPNTSAPFFLLPFPLGSSDWPNAPVVFGGCGGLFWVSRYSRRAWWRVRFSRLRSSNRCLVQALISINRTPLGRLI